MGFVRALAACGVVGGLAAVASADEVTLTPAGDNSIYEEYLDHSNGAGYLFAGRAGGGGIRRSLLRFDVAGALPAGARIDSASLSVTISRTPTGEPLPASLHRALADWGEAGSNAGERSGSGAPAQAGDATWSHRFYPTTPWSSPGGDFAATPSGVGELGGIGPATLGSSPGLVADAQLWLDEPDENFGWVLFADESSPSTAKRLDSRESVAATRPALRIVYTPAAKAVPLPWLARACIALLLALALTRSTPGRA